jgi:hypothetical protein
VHVRLAEANAVTGSLVFNILQGDPGRGNPGRGATAPVPGDAGKSTGAKRRSGHR